MRETNAGDLGRFSVRDDNLGDVDFNTIMYNYLYSYESYVVNYYAGSTVDQVPALWAYSTTFISRSFPWVTATANTYVPALSTTSPQTAAMINGGVRASFSRTPRIGCTFSAADFRMSCFCCCVLLLLTPSCPAAAADRSACGPGP